MAEKAKVAAKKKARKGDKDGATLASLDDDERATIKSAEIPVKPKRKGGRTTRRASRRTTAITPEITAICMDFAKKVHEQGVEKLGALFRDQLCKICPPTKPAPSFETNMGKNRFKDVVCLEETRVILNKEKPEDGDYIHANYVQFSGHDRRYIVTQAPKENTVEDFWRMVMQNECQVVLNLVSAEEMKDKGKCADYFPTEGSKAYGRYMIVVKKKEEEKDKTFIYTLEILAEGCSNSHIVRLIHATAWPEDKAMGSSRQILKLIKLVYTVDTLAKAPIVLHCSGGNGKTGVVILVDYMLFCIFKMKKSLDVTEVLTQLREQRASSVQSEAQFVYLNVATVFYISLYIANDEVTKWAEELEANFKEKYTFKDKNK